MITFLEWLCVGIGFSLIINYDPEATHALTMGWVGLVLIVIAIALRVYYVSKIKESSW